MSQRQAKVRRRSARLQRAEKREYEEQSARVGIKVGWRWALIHPFFPALRWVLPAAGVCAVLNWAAKHMQWRLDQGDWREFDPPRHFEPGDVA